MIGVTIGSKLLVTHRFLGGACVKSSFDPGILTQESGISGIAKSTVFTYYRYQAGSPFRRKRLYGP
jgi:hypothetical protein